MKINIKNLSLFLVIVDTLTIIQDVPKAIIISVVAIIASSFIITHKTLRTWFKILFLIAGIVILKQHFKPLWVTDAGVSFVLLLSALKLWELENENDYFNMFLILALLESCLFLLNPTFSAFFLGFIKIILFFYFILKIRNYNLSLLSGRRMLYLIGPSLILSILLFYTFPRFTQGFVTTNSQLLFSGTSSQLNIKNLGPLNLSTKIVFRVYGLNSKKLPIPFLYWRENVLWDYFKEEWKTGYYNLKSEQPLLLKSQANYKVQLVQDYNEFLPTLDGTSSITRASLEYNYFSEGSFRLRNISKSAVNYEVNSNYSDSLKDLKPLMLKKGLRLNSPKKEEIQKLILTNVDNPKTLNDEQKLDLAIEFFKNRHYEYSLNPSNYPSVEDFILYGKSGYCSHFASAFAYITRTIGLPSRIVSGYQGGEYNPFDQSIIVRELDGHAWVEVYLEKSGWYRYDPTAIVAPGRIQLGANHFFEEIEPNIRLFNLKIPKSLFKSDFYDQSALWLDSINSKFSASISNFDKESQQQFLSKLLPKSLSLGWIFALCLSGSLPLFWFIFSWLSRNKMDPAERRYLKFLKRMRREGFVKIPYESATSFKLRCLREETKLNEYINQETESYIKKYYRK